MPNFAKYVSYKYAFDQMKLAIEKCFYLEAVMIAESIISDRLHSASGTSEDKTNPKTGRPVFVSLKTLIQRARKKGMEEDLIHRLDQWRISRNTIAHAIARSAPGAPTMDVANFRALASETAKCGVGLVKDVKNWQRRSLGKKMRERK